MKLKLILGSIIIVILIAVYWLATHSYVAITINGTSGNSTITLTKQGKTSGTKTIIKGSSTKLLVANASYEILVQQGSKSYFQAITTKGFLRSTQVTAVPVAELGRAFVGDNPNQCMNLLSGVLFSNNCNGVNSIVNVHVPATADQPTYITPDSSGLGTLESNTTTSEGDLVLYAAPTTTSSDNPSAQMIYIYHMVGTKVVPTDQAKLSDLSTTTTYTIRPYLNGFVAYSSSFDHIWYYQSIHSKPVELQLNKPSVANAIAYSFSSDSNGTYTVAYSSIPQTTSKYAANGGKTITEVDLYNGSSVQTFTINGLYSDVNLCGTNRICLLGDDNLFTVNQIQDKKLKSLLSMANISTMVTNDNGVTVVRSPNTYLINPDTLSGSIMYSLGRYQYCGLETTTNGYIVCINDGTTKAALSINDTLTDTQIDKQVEQLRQQPDITYVSANNSIIFITPVGGGTVYDPTTNSYGPNPTAEAATNKVINTEIDKLGINRSVYTIVFTAPSQ